MEKRKIDEVLGREGVLEGGEGAIERRRVKGIFFFIIFNKNFGII